MLKHFLVPAVAACSVAAALPAFAASSVDVYLSAPFTQQASQSGAPDANSMFSPGYTNSLTETFNNAATQNYSTLNTTFGSTANNATSGTFSSGTGNFAVDANGHFGGGQQGNYLAVSSGGPTTLQLSAPVGYLGLEWCAVDGGNSIALYDQNNNLIGTFNAASFTSLLGASQTIKAINGNSYNTADYKGQPTGTSTTTNRQNANEYYAFVNFVAGQGTEISKIVIQESTGGAIFESDNYAILDGTAPAPLGSFVRVTSVPEPSTWAILSVATAGMALGVFRRRSPRA